MAASLPSCLQRKRHGLMEAWRRERLQFLDDSTALLQEVTQLAVERAETAAERFVLSCGWLLFSIVSWWR